MAVSKNRKQQQLEALIDKFQNAKSIFFSEYTGISVKDFGKVRDTLRELEKMVKMNVRLKNELNVDSRGYWKRTHSALQKISERLVKLANKVGQLK